MSVTMSKQGAYHWRKTIDGHPLFKSTKTDDLKLAQQMAALLEGHRCCACAVLRSGTGSRGAGPARGGVNSHVPLMHVHLLAVSVWDRYGGLLYGDTVYSCEMHSSIAYTSYGCRLSYKTMAQYAPANEQNGHANEHH